MLWCVVPCIKTGFYLAAPFPKFQVINLRQTRSNIFYFRSIRYPFLLFNHKNCVSLAVFMLETLKLSKTLKSSRDNFNVKYRNGKFTVFMLDVKVV